MATTRQSLLGMALLATLAATAWTAFDAAAPHEHLLPPAGAGTGRAPKVSIPRPPVAIAAPPTPARTPVPSAVAGPAAGWAEAEGNLFPARSPAAPMATGHPAAPLPVPEEPSPVLPFRYLGKLVEGGRVVAFLGRGNDVLLAHEGDVLGSWRVDALRVDGIRFTHLARGTQQDLAFGGSP